MILSYRYTIAVPAELGMTMESFPFILKKAFGFYEAKPKDKDYGVNYAVPELIELYNSSPQLKQVVDIAIKRKV